MMLLKQLIQRIVEHKDAYAAGKFADKMRLGGANHRETFEVIQRQYPNYTLAEFDELLRESE